MGGWDLAWTKTASSLQFKGSRIQFELNSQVLDCLDLAISNLSDRNLLAVQGHLQKAKSNLEKRIKVDPLCWEKSHWLGSVEEYESDELAEDSEDEKKLWAAEWHAFAKVKQKSAKPSG